MAGNIFFAWMTLFALFVFSLLLLLFCIYLFNRNAFYSLKNLLDAQVYKNIWVFITTRTKPSILNLDEDDYYSPQVVLLSQKNTGHCLKEFKERAEIEKTKTISKDGIISYGNIYLLKKVPYQLSDLNIKVKEINDMFSPLPKFNSLSLNHNEFIKNVEGYGFHLFAIFAGYEGEKITDIWIRKVHLESDSQFNLFLTVLNNLGKKWGLILVDWQKMKIIDLKNVNEVKAYLRREMRSGEYLIRVKGAEFPELDPEFDSKYIDKNPFGFKPSGMGWTYVHKDGRTFSFSPEPPGLQVSFSHTNAKEEKSILRYIQAGIKKATVIIQI